VRVLHGDGEAKELRASQSEGTFGESDVKRALTLHRPWIDTILDGEKTWEIRGEQQGNTCGGFGLEA
jgi:hypothetical protein